MVAPEDARQTEVRSAAMARTVHIARGVVVPYPEPTSTSATKVGQANRRTDTKPEIAIRSALHRRGLRFRKDHPVRSEGAKARVDICFARVRVAVFIDGCFWHSCPDHCTAPKSNQDYWVPKLRANVERDLRVTSAFEAAGWAVVRIWEHESVEEAAGRIETIVRSRRRVA